MTDVTKEYNEWKEHKEKIERETDQLYILLFPLVIIFIGYLIAKPFLY